MIGVSFKQPSDDAVLALLAKTPGPAPWYWQTPPAVRTNVRPLVWSLDESAPWADFSVRLHEQGYPGRIALAVAMYTTAFALPPNLLGLRFTEGAQIRVFAIDPDELTCLSAADFASNSHNYRSFASKGGVLGQFSIDTNLDPGEHPIELPPPFAGLGNLLIVGPYAKVQEAACAAIFEICDGAVPGSRRLRVLPQKWFNQDSNDIGYEWITRVVRDPASGRIVGDGIRLPNAFVLTEDGCRIDHWIETGPEWRRAKP